MASKTDIITTHIHTRVLILLTFATVQYPQRNKIDTVNCLQYSHDNQVSNEPLSYFNINQ